MLVKTSWTGKRRFVSKTPSGFEVAMDATETYGGDSQGVTPMELILAGVAGCIGIDVTMLLGRYLEQVNKIEIETEGSRREEMPTSFTNILVTFDVEGNIEGERIWKSIRLGHKKYCAVSDSLKANFDYQLILNGVPILEPS